MKSVIPPVRSTLQGFESKPLLENEQSSSLATHALPDVPLPLNPNIGDRTNNAVVVLTGTEGNDTITGTDGDEQIQGLGGDDVLIAGAGNDTVLGGAGNDIIYAGRSFSAGDVPPPTGPTDSNILFGGAGDDDLNGDEGIDVLSGDDGNDVLQDDNGDDFLYGGAGNDWLNGGSGADILDGGDGYDIVSYSYSNSISIDLTKSSSTWSGDALGDVFTSIEEFQLSGSSDVFVGAGGNDVVLGRSGNDTVSGGSGDDNLDGGSGDDVLNGGEGNDILHGGVGEARHGRHPSPPFGGNDSLDGGNGADTLDAGDGDDTLAGGLGADYLVGGVGADVFKYTAVEESQNVIINGVSQMDVIADFTQGQDKIDLSAIDANPTLAGNQAFTFIADLANYTGNWTGVVWQTTDSQTGITTINVSIDGDADPEMQIYMSQPYQLTANDFIL
jgi:Ca2+-binding RTX toxin-like protein